MKSIGFLFACGVFLLNSGFAFGASDNGLVTQLAKDAKISEEQAQIQVDSVFAALRSELLAGRDVTIKSFGRFAVQERAARTGRNPRTGEAIEIGARRYPHFTSSDKLKDSFNPEPTKKAAAVTPAAAPAVQAASK